MTQPNRWLTERVDQPELLDEMACSDEEAVRSLDDLRWLNRLIFGIPATLGVLHGWLRDATAPATVLELGTGSGQMAQALAQWAARERRTVRVIALDFTQRHLAHARRWNERLGTPAVHLLGGDALALPLADQSVDYVTSSLFLHHFDDAALLRLFAECRRVARRGLVMSDLWRHALPFYLYKGVAEPLLVRSPVTRTDSTISFQRAYRPDEIAAIAGQALPGVRVVLHPLSMRWVLSSRWEQP